jgi:hypothetical protein
MSPGKPDLCKWAMVLCWCLIPRELFLLVGMNANMVLPHPVAETGSLTSQPLPVLSITWQGFQCVLWIEVPHFALLICWESTYYFITTTFKKMCLRTQCKFVGKCWALGTLRLILLSLFLPLSLHTRMHLSTIHISIPSVRQ